MASKTTYKKSLYPNAKPFTNAELYKIIQTKNWMSLDLKNETATEAMKANNIRYITILVTDLEGKVRPLKRMTAPTQTKSKCNPGKTDKGKTPSKFSFSTRIMIPYKVGDKLPDGKIVDQKFIDDKIDELADTAVSEKFPNATEDEFSSLAEKQSNIIKGEYIQWQIEMAINSEFNNLMNDKNTRVNILKWSYKPKEHNIKGNVQYSVTPAEDDVEAMKKVNSDGVIMLEYPMVYYYINIDKLTGNLWCKIYDMSKETAAKKHPHVMVKNEQGKMEFLNMKNLQVWMRPYSVYAGSCKYQLCLHGKGASLHTIMTEMLVRRSAQRTSESSIDKETEKIMCDFGDDFDNGDSSDDVSDVVVPKSELTDVEKQLQAMEANASKDF